MLRRAASFTFALALLFIMGVIWFAAPAAAQVPSSSHVFLVVLENTSFSTMTNPADSTTYMPWLVNLGNTYGFANNYTSDNAGSLLDYLWLSSGSCEGSACTLPSGDHNFGCTGGSCSSSITDDNIYREMISKGISWKLYSESIPSVGYMGGRITDPTITSFPCCSSYDPHHNGPKWYSDIINSTTQQGNMVPFTQFATDMNANQLPNYSFIIPNDNDEAHDGNPIQADAWLQSNLTPLLNQPFFQCGGDGILIITFDNDDRDHAAQVYTAVIGPRVIPHFVSNVAYKHENTLRTILDALGITTYPGYSATASPMSDFFGTPAACSGAAVLTSISPSRTAPSGPSFTLTVNGSNFNSSSVVLWNNSSRATTFVSSTQLTATILASDIAGAGTDLVTVSNSGTISNTAYLIVTQSIIGVLGQSPALGVSGIASGTTGIGIQGQANATSGTTFGITGLVQSSSGIAGVFDNTAGGNILTGAVNGTNKFRVDGAGNVYETAKNTGGADFAESLAVLGDRTRYEPGDVLVIDPTGIRRMALASEPYSSRAAGIYSTKPGVLASPYVMDDPRLAREIPLAVVGIVPCKVSAENGPIQEGDLLVTSSTPGYAMKGSDRSRMLGAVIGKALEPLHQGKGIIEVLVTLQ